jgi:hypothetical protein
MPPRPPAGCRARGRTANGGTANGGTANGGVDGRDLVGRFLHAVLTDIAETRAHRRRDFVAADALGGADQRHRRRIAGSALRGARDPVSDGSETVLHARHATFDIL